MRAVLFFNNSPLFTLFTKKGKGKVEERKKNTATTTTTTKRETVPTTNLHFLIVSYKKKEKHFL